MTLRTLVVPPAAQRDERAVQMLSAWIAEKGMHCTLNIGFFDGQGHKEGRSWGIFLADVIRHVGKAWAEERGVPAEETIAAVLQALNAELDEPTSKAEGSFHPGHS